MFRDDLVAARERIDQLERELARAEARAEISEEEFAKLQVALHAQEEELARLRKATPEGSGSEDSEENPRDGASDPRSRRQRALRRRRVLVFSLVIVGFLGGVSLVFFSRSGAPSRASEEGVLGPERMVSPSASVRRIRVFVRHIAKRCTVTATGSVSACRPPTLRDEVSKLEARVGTEAAFLGYCGLLPGYEATARIAARRIGAMSMAWRKLDTVDVKVFQCLDGHMRGNRVPRALAARVAYAWARLAVRFGQKESALAWLRTAPTTIRAEAFRGLWSVLHLKILPEILPLLKSRDVDLAVAGLRALGSIGGEAERAGVCPILKTLCGNHPDQRVAALAGLRLATWCKGAGDAAIFGGLDRALSRGGHLDSGWIAAIATIAHPSHSASPVLQEKALAILEKLLGDLGLSDARRAQALASIYKLDSGRGRRLAKAYRDASDVRLRSLRHTARRILGVAPKGRRPWDRKIGDGP